MFVTARGKQEHSKKEIHSIIQQGSIKLIESDSEVVYNVTKDSISNQSCFYFIFIKESWKYNACQFTQKCEVAKKKINIDN